MTNASEQNSQSGKSIPPAESIVYLLFCGLALGLFALVPQQVGKPVTLFGAAPEGLSPGTMPRFVLLALAVVACAGAAKSFRNSSQSISRPSRHVVVTCIASFLFAALLVPLGFVLASGITVVSLAVYLGGRSWLGLTLGGIAVPLALYLAFTRVLHIALPAGVLGF